MEINESIEFNNRKFSPRRDDYQTKHSNLQNITSNSSFNFISNLNNQNAINCEIDEDGRSKKTNSTGDMTPTKSQSVSQDLIDQLLLNENFINLNSVNEVDSNRNMMNQINKTKIIEYLQKEKETLESKNKTTFSHKKPYKIIKTNMFLLQINTEKYFSLPLKDKAKEKNLKKNNYYNDKICKEP